MVWRRECLGCREVNVVPKRESSKDREGEEKEKEKGLLRRVT